MVNKADRDGADRIKAELELNVHLRPAVGWRPPVLLTQASEDVGVDALVEAIGRHADYVKEHPDATRGMLNGALYEFTEVLTGELEERAQRSLLKVAAEARACGGMVEFGSGKGASIRTVPRASLLKIRKR